MCLQISIVKYSCVYRLFTLENKDEDLCECIAELDPPPLLADVPSVSSKL